MDSSTFTPRMVYFQYKESLISFYYYLCFIRSPVFNANSVDSDQMPGSAASDLGLQSLSVSLLWDARHTWVNL